MIGGYHPSKEVGCLFLLLQKAGVQEMWILVLKLERLYFFHLSNFFICEK